MRWWPAVLLAVSACGEALLTPQPIDAGVVGETDHRATRVREFCVPGQCHVHEGLAEDDAGSTGRAPPLLSDAPDQTLTAGVPMTSLGLDAYVTATDGDAITSYSLTAGALPAGLTFDLARGIIAGTPTLAGTTHIAWAAADRDGVSSTSDAVRFTVLPSGPSSDPGLFTGTWRPAGLSDVWVVDQSELNGVSSTTSIPGCANQHSQLGSNYCGPSLVETVNGVQTTLTLAVGRTLSVRYLAEAVVVSGQYFKVTGGDGSGVPTAMDVSLSRSPADFSAASACSKTGVSGSQPLLIVGGATGCPVAPDTLYYLNIRSTSPCTGGICRLKILEPASMTL